MWLWIAEIAGGLALGSVLFCRLVPRAVRGVDVCALSDDGNPGAANVFTHCGWKLGMVCLLLDMAKGFAPVFFALHFSDAASPLFAAVILAPVAGHAFSPMNRFRGGKCIATTFGVLIALLWITPTGWILAALYILFSTVLKIRPNRRRSVVAFALFAVSAGTIELLCGRWSIAAGDVLMSAVAVLKHTLLAWDRAI